MYVIPCRNVNQALPQALNLMKKSGVVEDSRNGQVTRLHQPVTTVYERPMERVLFSPARDANPFFHMVESMWMLAGQRDVATLRPFNSKLEQFSDNGKWYWGAYGFRWREWFSEDQIDEVVKRLKRDLNTRRAVIAIYDGHADSTYDQKDLPCNLTVAFRVRKGMWLDMTVFNRSNDLLWGAYGANVVHFSYLQEYIAIEAGVNVGVYNQISNDLHMYDEEVYGPMYQAVVSHVDGAEQELYTQGSAEAQSMFFDLDDWELFKTNLSHLREFLAWARFEDTSFKNVRLSRFFEGTLYPMVKAHYFWKEGDWDAAMDCVTEIESLDWRVGCGRYLARRRKQHAQD